MKAFVLFCVIGYWMSYVYVTALYAIIKAFKLCLFRRHCLAAK